ncbi:hypothetical protein [Aeromicrobium sp. Leaf289]|uniref:hypothetical protein n=1 Tax=Aeromicrobium sp. Leaf289 TaxID=1736324 RepID=UPI0012E19093|nr:hypothetical protein [Aeromicrobium sp. Leaf289]
MGVELPQFLLDLTADGWAALAAFLALGLTLWNIVARRIGGWRSGRRAHLRIELGCDRRDRSISGSVAGRIEVSEHFFAIWNTGPADAYDIEVEPVAADDPDDRDWQTLMFSSRQFPLPRVHPGQSVKVDVFVGEALPSSFDVTIRWNDNRKRRQRTGATLYRPS